MMVDLFDFINDHLSACWFDDFHKAWGDSLTDEMVLQSVQEASDFFNMNAPMDVHEDWTTGVMTGIPFTENDDVLVFNRQQMLDMGITDKEGFDLVMTHEGAHRALQGLNTGFDSHQEELCCDYMAGVRAGLNGMDEVKMEASLSGTAESESHPNGAARVAAIEAGVSFAHDYMVAHNGVPPTFSDCLDHFNQTDVCSSTVTPQDAGHVNLRPDVAFTDVHGFVNDKSYHLDRAESAQRNAEWHEKRAEAAIDRGDLRAAKEHTSKAESFRKWEQVHIKSAQRSTQ